MFQSLESTNSVSSKKSLTLDTSLRYLKGVGPKLAEIFAKKNLHVLRDLIHWYPRTYRDQRMTHDFSSLTAGSYVTMYGEVAQKRVLRLGKRKRIYEMIVNTSGGSISCKYFHLPYRGYFDSINIDQSVKVSGRISFYRRYPEMHHPDIHPFNENEKQEDELIPVYTELEHISQYKIRKLIHLVLSALKDAPEFLCDPLPKWLLEKYQLIDRFTALKEIHQPDAQFSQDYFQFRSPAQRRLIFEEFFLLQLYMAQKKVGLEKEHADSMTPSYQLRDQLKNSLSFKLTTAQERTVNEISQDLCQSFPMHRLVQGDVGCGKTIVAALAACQVIENHFQCALMAPTEILAEQHYHNLSSLLNPLGIRTALLTGKTKAKEKRMILEQLATGYTMFCVGTHALIQEQVQFHKLGLVIIDEQHRFGAHQRSLLKEKGKHPHFLVMTATPIPRSLAMTFYGDLDVSVIDEMPPGRQKIITRKTYLSRRNKVLGFLEEQIKKGRQAYVVYPLVEESEHIDLKNATAEYEKLKEQFTQFKIGLLHGRMSVDEKQKVMLDFVNGDIQILVSTTVIEVGVDVANVSMMIVENAERFGLSQLHQLRGRVGRGIHQSYCVLILGGGFSKEADARLSMMEKTNDGFKIAEADLELRGPGEFLGTRQSGLPEFKLASLVRDGRLLQEVKQAANQLIQMDPLLENPQHQQLKKEMEVLADKFLPG